MVDLFSNLLDYVNRTAPAVGLIALIFVLARPNRQVRVLLYTLTFILLRDALTPSSLWSLGIAGGVPWIRFYPSHLFLIGMGVSSLLFTVLLVVGDRENSQDVVFLRKGDSLRGWIASVVGLVVVLTPILIASHRIGIEERGGAVDPNLLGSILVFALSGNLLEELLFRGYVYNLLKRRDADLKAGVMSGFIFALCHVFLATTVTSIGVPLLLFTVWEGVICGIVGGKYGVLPAAAVHGGAIFVLASGLI